MTHFKGIPIRIEPGPRADGTTIAKSILHEIRALMERLLDTGESGAIDLRALPPLGPEGYGLLKDHLAEGEVTAEIRGLGHTEIRETAYAGVWWVTLRNQKNETITELIEITEVPAILKSQREDIRAGLTRMSQRLPLIA